MKIILIIGIALMSLMACEPTDCCVHPDQESIIGEWRLVEILIDPGDGSGVFMPVQSDKLIHFFADNTFSSSGNICSMDIHNQPNTEGEYNIQDSTLSNLSCAPDLNPTVRMRFKVSKEELTIHHFCIEPCISKYRRE